jgi:transcriptional regulator NrdR family protein
MCPACGGDAKVTESRKLDGSVYRKRQCKERLCKHIYFTEERCISLWPARLKAISVERLEANIEKRKRE